MFSKHLLLGGGGGKIDPQMAVIAEDLDVGDEAVITCRFKSYEDVTGTCSCYYNNVLYSQTISSSVAIIKIPNLSAGVYNLDVIYSGDSKYAEDVQTASFEVCKVPSFLILNAYNIICGENEVINGTVPVDASGTIQLTISDGNNSNQYTKNVVDGNMQSLTIQNLPSGSYTVSGYYSGDNKYESCYAQDGGTSFTVSKMSLSSDDFGSYVDDGTGTSGYITYTQGLNLSGGTFTLTINNINYTGVIDSQNSRVIFSNYTASPGPNLATLTYSGNTYFNSYTTNLTITGPQQTPTMTISFGANEYYVGDTVVITCTLPNDATGTVTLSVDDTQYTGQLSNGVATFNITGLLAGNKSVYASYPGDSKYTNTTQTGTVSITKKTFLLLSTPSGTYSDSYYENQNNKYQRFRLKIPSDADVDKLYIQCNGTSYFGSISSESSSYKYALIEIFGLLAGKYSAVIGYLGDDIYLTNDNVYTLAWSVRKKESIS